MLKMEMLKNIDEKTRTQMIEMSLSVVSERVEQNSKWGVQRHNAGKWLAILMEEVGEVAQASQSALGLTTGKETDADDLEMELIQVAAVASAWAEQLREERMNKLSNSIGNN